MRLKAYIIILPAKQYKNVVLKLSANAITKDKNKTIILMALQPSIIRATNFPLITTFIEGSVS
jgi:hypothetical protein